MSRFASVDYTLPSFDLAVWESCPDCSAGPTPGSRAVMAYWLESFDGIASSMGIYNCRPVRESSSLSMHACGRADDLGVPVSVAGHRVAVEFLTRLAPHAKSLGIQLLIFSRQSGSARHPWPTRYGGVHPHYDHIHLELNRRAAERLTLATLRARVGDFRDAGTSTPEIPTVEPDGSWEDALLAALPTVRFDQGDRDGPDVRTVQSLLAVRGHPPAATFDDGEPDGLGRARTRAALEAFQRRTRTGAPDGSPDLIVGDRTWGKLTSIGLLRFDRGVIRGVRVGVVQALLAARGYPPTLTFDDRGVPDRVGASRTREALAAFQDATGTGGSGSPDLIVGPRTWTALHDVQ